MLAVFSIRRMKKRFGNAILSPLTAACALLAATMICPPRQTGAAPQTGTRAFTFRNTDYFHRWSQNTQHEFTPDKQEDLKAWTDMVTINLYPEAKDGDTLAARANATLENYKAAKAMVLNTRSVPRTADQPAEHFIAVVFGRPTFIEVAFARFKLVDGVGCSVVYSHRIYGEKIGDGMSAWLRENGEPAEKALMQWNSIGAAVVLARDLGRSKT